MLVIGRKVGEHVWVGEARVKVIRSGKGGVQLGIEAPAHVHVSRKSAEEKEGADERLLRV